MSNFNKYFNPFRGLSAEELVLAYVQLNRAARLVPKDVKGFASLIANAPHADADAVQDIVNLLDDYAHDAENDLIFKLQNQ